MTAILSAARAAWPWLRDRAWPWAWAHRSLVILFVIGLLLSCLAWSCHVGCAAERRAGAAQEGARAAGTGTAIVPAAASGADLAARAAKLLQENSELRAGKDALSAEVGRLTLRYVVQGRASGKVDAKPRPPDPPGAPAPTPVLAQGDEIQLELEGVGLQGPRGAPLALATVAARRGSDGELLLRRLLTAPATQAAVDEGIAQAPPARPPRDWRFGATLGVTEDGFRGGWRASAIVARRVRLGDDRLVLLQPKVGPKRLSGGERAWSGELAIGLIW